MMMDGSNSNVDGVDDVVVVLWSVPGLVQGERGRARESKERERERTEAEGDSSGNDPILSALVYMVHNERYANGKYSTNTAFVLALLYIDIKASHHHHDNNNEHNK